MQRDMDTIQFESRVEIGEIIHALENSTDKDNETVQEFIGLLDIMSMCW